MTITLHAFRRCFSVAVVVAVLAPCAVSAAARDALHTPVPARVAQHDAESARDPQRPWCQTHSAYEDECFICRAELREKGRLWCNEHGRYEDRCWLCHPELRDAARPYCEKHFLYEDECHLCHPELKKKTGAAAPGGADAHGAHDHAASAPDDGHGHAASAASSTGDAHDHGAAASPDGSAARLWCEEHGVAEGECGICHPELATELGHGRGVKIRFASMEAARDAGIETARPRIEPIAAAVECVGEIMFDANKVAEIATPVTGVVETVAVDLGARVEPGDVLATVSSAEIAAAVNEARLARQTLERERRLYAERVSAQKEVQSAEAAYRTAHERLRALGFDEEQIAGRSGDAANATGIAKTAADAAVLELRAPVAGEIVERSVAPRTRVDAGEALLRIADRSTMWAELAVPEPALAEVRVGQRVALVLDGEPERMVEGTLTWVAPGVDDRTRMGRARVEVPNAGGALRAHAFVRARIATAQSDRALVVPRAAIQHVDDQPFAFVKLADDLFEARRLRLGASTADRVEVTEGLTANDDVVVAHSFLVKSQLQISRLGAGCTH